MTPAVISHAQECLKCGKQNGSRTTDSAATWRHRHRKVCRDAAFRYLASGEAAPPFHAPRRVSPETEARIVRLAQEGLKDAAIARETGQSTSVVKRVTRKHGLGTGIYL